MDRRGSTGWNGLTFGTCKESHPGPKPGIYKWRVTADLQTFNKNNANLFLKYHLIT